MKTQGKSASDEELVEKIRREDREKKERILRGSSCLPSKRE